VAVNDGSTGREWSDSSGRCGTATNGSLKDAPRTIVWGSQTVPHRVRHGTSGSSGRFERRNGLRWAVSPVSSVFEIR